MSRKIYIRGTWLESFNVGDNAIVEGLKLALKERGELKAFTGGVDRVQNWLGIDGIKIISRRNPFLFLKVFIELRNAKAFLLTGGTPIYGDVSQMLINYLIVLICRLYGIPVFVFGVSYRDCSSRLVRFIIEQIFINCERIYLRELGSIERVKAVYSNKVATKVDFLPDPATQINFEIDLKGTAGEQRQSTSSFDQPYVVICPRNFSVKKSFASHHYSRTFDDGNYLKTLTNAISHLLKTSTYKIVFLPMNTISPDDDRVAISYILTQLQEEYGNRLDAINDQLHPFQVAEILRRATFAITVRFHAGVLSCSNGTPILSLAYDKKNLDISEVLEMKNLTFDLNSIDDGELLPAIDHIVLNLGELTEHCKNNNLRSKRVFESIVATHFPKEKLS